MLLKNLHKGRFIRRYKRFLMDLEYNNQILTVYTPNTGSMKTVFTEQSFIYFSESLNKNRKLAYTAEIVENNLDNKKEFVFINTQLANQLVLEEILDNHLEEFKNIDEWQRELPYGKNRKSRIDIFLKKRNKQIFIEVKNATLRVKNDYLAFPDAITKRGQKHLIELADLMENNLLVEAYVIFLASRYPSSKFLIADFIDKEFYKQAIKTKNSNVKFLAYQVNFQIIPDENRNLYNVNLEIKNKLEILNL